jgi:hypothetical protein
LTQQEEGEALASRTHWIRSEINGNKLRIFSVETRTHEIPISYYGTNTVMPEPHSKMLL